MSESPRIPCGVYCDSESGHSHNRNSCSHAHLSRNDSTVLYQRNYDNRPSNAAEREQQIHLIKLEKPVAPPSPRAVLRDQLIVDVAKEMRNERITEIERNGHQLRTNRRRFGGDACIREEGTCYAVLVK